MSLLVVGSMALDTITTPFGKAEDILGGSAVYFGTAASFFTDVAIVAVVGTDFPEKHTATLARHGIDISGIKRVEGETFRWKGNYSYDMNVANTEDTQLNVFEAFSPLLDDNQRACEYVFLANIDPSIQLDVLDQLNNPRLIAMDTMNYWIQSKREELIEVISRCDIILLNDAEARMLTGNPNLFSSGRKILEYGPDRVIIKKGEHGVLMLCSQADCDSDSTFLLPAYPLETVYDPTGAGDSFGGGFMGYIAGCGKPRDEAQTRKAVVYGSVMASFCVESFSLQRLLDVKREDIEGRVCDFPRFMRF